MKKNKIKDATTIAMPSPKKSPFENKSHKTAKVKKHISTVQNIFLGMLLLAVGMSSYLGFVFYSSTKTTLVSNLPSSFMTNNTSSSTSSFGTTTTTTTADIRKRHLDGFKEKRKSNQQPKTITTQRNNNNHKNDNTIQYHILFSTGCSLQQHWESYVLFYHAMKVQQPGNITRLVSGCESKQEERQLRKFHTKYIHKSMSNKFHIHFTPDYSTKLEDTGFVFKPFPYKYNNKPNSVHHWMVNVLFNKHKNDTNHTNANNNETTTTTTIPSATLESVQDDIIILMDPDMILLRPLLHNFSNQNMIYAIPTTTTTEQSQSQQQTQQSQTIPKFPQTKIVKHGMPMAQHDGYLTDEWQKFNFSYITAADDHHTNNNGKSNNHGKVPTNNKFDKLDGYYYYNSGPPYLATVRDMWNMVNVWKEYVPRVYTEYPKIFAEMYGLVIATTQLQLPHTLVKSIVVSNPETKDREGWAFVDAIPDDQICTMFFESKQEHQDQQHQTSTIHSKKNDNNLPIILHYCRRYILGKFFFSKYRLKKKFISCEAPLLTVPPNDLATRYDYWIRPPPDRGFSHTHEMKNITKVQAKREAFMLCGLISAVNEASRFYKQQHCGETGNYSETYNFHDDPYST